MFLFLNLKLGLDIDPSMSIAYLFDIFNFKSLVSIVKVEKVGVVKASIFALTLTTRMTIRLGIYA